MKHKRELNFYSFSDHTHIARHLEDMAARGWELEKFNFNGLFRYRRAEPKTVHYAVTYFPKASNFDPGPSEGQQAFTDLCEAAGWEKVGQSFQMQIFRSRAEDPVPLETEPQVQVENVHKAMRSNFLIGSMFMMVVCAVQVLLGISSIRRDPLSALLGSTSIAPILYGLLFLHFGLELIAYSLWHRRAMRTAQEQGAFLPTPATRPLQFILLSLVVVLFALYATSAGSLYLSIAGIVLVLSAAAHGVSMGLRQLLKRLQVDASINRVATIGLNVILMMAGVGILTYGTVEYGWFSSSAGAETYEFRGETYTAYHDALPLTLSDLTQWPDSGYSTRLSEEGSFLFRRTQARQHLRYDAYPVPAEQPTELSYHIWSSPIPALLDMAVAEEMAKADRYIPELYQQGYVPTSAALWNAEEAWVFLSGSLETYLLRYDHHVVCICFYFSPSPDQISTAAGALSGF